LMVSFMLVRSSWTRRMCVSLPSFAASAGLSWARSEGPSSTSVPRTRHRFMNHQRQDKTGRPASIVSQAGGRIATGFPISLDGGLRGGGDVGALGGGWGRVARDGGRGEGG